MQPAERGRQADGEAQELCQFQRTSQQSIERLAAGVGEDEHRPPLVRHERERLSGPPGIEFGPQGVSCSILRSLAGAGCSARGVTRSMVGGPASP